MTLLERSDGEAAEEGVSYLELADLLIRLGSNTGADLEPLWRRIAFSVCVSNTDDHLRNHGFLLSPSGWQLAPAYDMNPDPYGAGLKLNISESDNAQNLDLLREVAPFFRLGQERAAQVLGEVLAAVKGWATVAEDRGLSAACRDRMGRAFRVAK
jgi:serine/threonine-protein kinase HipA